MTSLPLTVVAVTAVRDLSGVEYCMCAMIELRSLSHVDTVQSNFFTLKTAFLRQRCRADLSPAGPPSPPFSLFPSRSPRRVLDSRIQTPEPGLDTSSKAGHQASSPTLFVSLRWCAFVLVQLLGDKPNYRTVVCPAGLARALTSKVFLCPDTISSRALSVLGNTASFPPDSLLGPTDLAPYKPLYPIQLHTAPLAPSLLVSSCLFHLSPLWLRFSVWSSCIPRF